MAIGISAEAAVGRHLRVGHDHLFRIDGRQFRHLDQSQAQVFPRTGPRMPVLRRVEPSPSRHEVASDADRALPMAAEPVPPIKAEPPTPAPPASAGSRPQRLQKPQSIVPPQPGCAHFAPSIFSVLKVNVVENRLSGVATIPAAWDARPATRLLRPRPGPARIFRAAVGLGLGLRAPAAPQIAPLVQ